MTSQANDAESFLKNQIDHPELATQRIPVQLPCDIVRAQYFHINDGGGGVVLQFFLREGHEKILYDYWDIPSERALLEEAALAISAIWENVLPEAIAQALTYVGRSPLDSTIDQINQSIGGPTALMSWYVALPGLQALDLNLWMEKFAARIINGVTPAIPAQTLAYLLSCAEAKPNPRAQKPTA